MSQSPATRRISDLPGPRGLPLIGNLVNPTRLHLVAEEWSRRYGPCFRFSVGRREFFVVTDAETIAGVLRDRPDGFQRTSRIALVAREMGFDGLFAANGERWRRQRPMVMASFDPAHTKSFFPALVRVTERFARRWQRAAAAGEEIDLQADLMRYTVDVTAGLAFGADINTIEAGEEVIQQHLDKIMPALSRRLLSPLPYWLLSRLPRNRALGGHVAALRAAVADFIARARDRIKREPSLREQPGNLMEALIVAREAPGSGLDDADVSGNVLTMLLAGEDTTANTLAWMIYLLARHPEATRRATEEVHRVLDGQPFPTRYEQISALGFVEACANETMRLKPVAPIIVAEAVRDRVVAGVEVPAGQLVMCLMRPAATDARHFANPGAFEPERWLGESASSAKRVSMPFGAGPRLCPGRYLAMLEIKNLIAMLLAGFEVERISTPDGGDAREHLAITMAPVGLRAKLRVRQ
jgi:cytochrome P450